MAIGNRIKLFRNNNQLTQKQLAELTGLKTITIQSYELNKRTPSIKMINKLSQVLNVSVKTLLCDEIFENEILNKAINLMIPILPKGADDVFAYLEEYTHDYDSLYNLYNKNADYLPISCTKGLLNFIFKISEDDFEEIYKDLISTNVYDLDPKIKDYCDHLHNKIIDKTSTKQAKSNYNKSYDVEREKFENKYKKIGAKIDGNTVILPPISFEEMKEEVDKVLPALDAEIRFLSDPNVEKVFNYSFDELAKQGGYHELLITAIEKAIRDTLNNINAHLESGDLFDGVSSWITKESPLYEILKERKNK